MSNSGALEALVRILGDALTPLATRLQGDEALEVMEQLGLRAAGLTSPAVVQNLQEAATASSQLANAVTALVNAAAGSDDDALISAALQLGQLIVRAGTSFGELGSAIHAAVQGDGSLSATQKARLNAVADKLPERLAHLALITYVEDRQPAVKSALDLAGIFDDIDVFADPADDSLPAHRLRQVRFDRIGDLFTDPAEHLKQVYGFGTSGFDGLELFRRIKKMVDRPEGEAILIEAPGQPAALDAMMFRLAVIPGGMPSLGIRLRIPAEKDLDVSVPIAGPWSATVGSKARFEGGIEMQLHPQNGLHIEPPTAAASLDVALGIKAENADGSPMILIGQAGGSRLELQSFAARIPLKLSASAGAPSPNLSLGAALDLKQGKIVIDGSQADGFLATLIGGVKVESAFDLGASFDTDEGLRFTGSATIEIAIPTHLSLGPIEIPQVYLIGGFADGSIPVEFSADIGAQLGPLSVSVSRMGAEADITFPDGGGNAGPLQIDVGFKAPTGVGLSIDAGIVKGGGFLYLDFDKQEYAGALELVFSGFLTVKAIGLITTRMPDGSDGFSLLVIVSAEFGTPFQLGFGFTLNAVGGLLGLNRSMEQERIAQGIRTGAIESIMFPDDIIENAPRIISDLREFFPPANDTFLIGPMAKLGWGTPTLVTASIGVVVEIPPGNIAILGILKVALPDEDAALIVIQVNFIGALEVDKKRLWFAAFLYESRVLFITLEGGMGLLIAWGDDANFVLSVGGFHPSFNPPALPFDNPPRIAISILNTSFARIRVEGYFAVTSNTVQFGARVEIFFGVSAFNIDGHIGFDALFQFSPFYFIITISASLSVKVFGIGLFSVRMRGELEGTSPWHIEGEGSISLLFWDIDVPFSHTWGESEDTTLPPIQIMPKLKAEFEKLDNWTAEVPAANNLLVSLRHIEVTEDLILHPVGVLKVSQRAIPLDLDLDKIGNQRPTDAKRVKVEILDADVSKVDNTKESFATAQFKELSDAKKLSAPAYEKQNSGLTLSVAGEQLKTHSAVKRVVRYEENIIDNNFKGHLRRFVGFSLTLFTHFLQGNAASRSRLSALSKSQKAPVEQKIKVNDALYVVASSVDNTPHGEAAKFTTHAEAQDFLRAERARAPSQADALHVIPAAEARDAA
jgi:hypothetical protein